MRTFFFIGVVLWAFLPGKGQAQTPREIMSIVIYEPQQVAGESFILVTHADGTQKKYLLRDRTWWLGARQTSLIENEAIIVRVFAEYFAQGWEVFSVSEKFFRVSNLERERYFTRYLLARPKTN
ncbi:MAG: hypothetical protein RMJ33_12145 [Saprospiraceae bacterium]|nr:hypothetical protein [Saprospiraceae bacterium]MDW8230578.1 hypothetical protein [Saprospiraceae bacterium]